MNRSTFVNVDPPLPKVKLAPEYATLKVILHCVCGHHISGRTTDAVGEMYADHRAYVHGVRA